MVMSAAEMKRLAREAMAEGLTLQAERHRAVATPKTPKEYGDLRSAHTVDPATPDDLLATVTNDLPYAAKQHEDLTLRHDDGQAKFFELASAEIEGEAQEIMAAAIRRRLG
ncbi:hypothetical protein [Promicromonospora iranensis]|uniref:Uncharacterized protein n=1 Tax=Promicromonospora iranensis TaxID=1105144 RepID=A0ABU2CV47_9MICO|nr:hypothetical protein [Promicromonospora iranensis]MDR7385211.1 hypothetical protein [Promicromonospora iranensis]